MKVLQLNEWTKPAGGVEVYIAQLQQLLPSYNVESYWIGIHSYADDYTVTIAGAAEEHRFKQRKEVIYFLQAFLQEKQIDLIAIHNIFDTGLISYCLSAKPVLKFAHSPIMVCPGREKFWRHSVRICNKEYGLHCFYHIYKEGCANRHPKRVLAAWQYVQYEVNKASKCYKKIIVMSDYISKGLQEVGIAEEQIACIPYFTQEIAEVNGATISSEKRLLFVGRLAESKGVTQLLQAIVPILKKKENIKLDIVGDGSLRTALEAYVAKEQVADKVMFHGWLDRTQVATMFESAYLFVFPSVYPEAFGIVGIEAMMHAKPVVAFNVGGVQAWLENGKTGLLVENGSTQAMNVAIQSLLDDEELYATLSSGAKKNALEKFLPQIHLQQLLKEYTSCLQ